MSDAKLFRLSGSTIAIDMRTGHNATLRPGLVVLSEDAHTHAMAALATECERLRGQRADWQQRAEALGNRLDATAELAALKGRQEPAGYAYGIEDGADSLEHTMYTLMPGEVIPHGCTALYTAPPAQASAWVPVSERLPDAEQRLDKPCEIEGKPLPPLNITRQVQVFDGKRVFADCIEWFDGGRPLKGITHWRPLDAPPVQQAGQT